VLFHEFGEDFVFALELGLELFDFLILGIALGLGFSAVLEGEVGVFEELALPMVEEGGADVEFIAEIGDGDAFEEMAFDDGHLFVGLKMTLGTFFGHGRTSVQVMLTRSKPSSRSD
jgi:hypothetical protein